MLGRAEKRAGKVLGARTVNLSFRLPETLGPCRVEWRRFCLRRVRDDDGDFAPVVSRAFVLGRHEESNRAIGHLRAGAMNHGATFEPLDAEAVGEDDVLCPTDGDVHVVEESRGRRLVRFVFGAAHTLVHACPVQLDGPATFSVAVQRCEIAEALDERFSGQRQQHGQVVELDPRPVHRYIVDADRRLTVEGFKGAGFRHDHVSCEPHRLSPLLRRVAG